MILTIASFESRSLARSPLTWLLAAVIALVFAYLFLQALEAYLDAQPKLALQDHPSGLGGFLAVRYLAPLVMLFALVAPLLAMRSFSDEFRHQTLALWLSSPVSISSLVIGKFIGVVSVIFALVLMAALFAASMRFFTPLDLGVLSAATLGLTLAACMFSAIGMFFSSLTKHAIFAVAASVLLLVLLWLVGSAGNSSAIGSVLNVFSIPAHLNGFFQGYISSADVLYFVLITLLFVALTIVRLDALRHTGR